MSDFDKEAERQRLREKYEKDREDRETTQRMSELLLQGATMTNKHCDTCGNPIFRYQGQEFCPVCQDAERAADAEAATEATAEAAQSEAVAEPAEGAPEQASSAAEPDAADASATPAADAAETGPEAPQRGASGQSPTAPDRPEAGDARPPAAGDASLDEARASLVRTVTTFARRAADADDPRTARDHLAAAREAAEALAALPR